MARDRGEDPGKRRWGRGKPEEGPSDEDLGWLADLRGGPGDRALGDEPRQQRLKTRQAHEIAPAQIERIRAS